MREFNVVLPMEDKMEGNPMTLTEVIDFQNCLEEGNPNTGCKFFLNVKQESNKVFSKIDWSLIMEISWITCPLSEHMCSHRASVIIAIL